MSDNEQNFAFNADLILLHRRFPVAFHHDLTESKILIKPGKTYTVVLRPTVFASFQIKETKIYSAPVVHCNFLSPKWDS